MTEILLLAGRMAPWGEKAGQPSFFDMSIHCDTEEQAEQYLASLPKGLGATRSATFPDVVSVHCWANSLGKLQRVFLASMDYLAVHNLPFRWCVWSEKAYSSMDEFAEELQQLIQKKGQ